MPSPGRPNRLRRPLVSLGVLLLLLAASVYGVWRWWGHRGPDMVAVLHANNRGVGSMEQFDYDRAVHAFEEAGRLAPDWLPARINLGIALLNRRKEVEEQGRSTPVDLPRAIALFEDVLRTDPNNPYAHYCLGIILQYQGKIQ